MANTTPVANAIAPKIPPFSSPSATPPSTAQRPADDAAPAPNASGASTKKLANDAATAPKQGEVAPTDAGQGGAKTGGGEAARGRDAGTTQAYGAPNINPAGMLPAGIDPGMAVVLLLMVIASAAVGVSFYQIHSLNRRLTAAERRLWQLQTQPTKVVFGAGATPVADVRTEELERRIAKLDEKVEIGLKPRPQVPDPTAASLLEGLRAGYVAQVSRSREHVFAEEVAGFCSRWRDNPAIGTRLGGELRSLGERATALASQFPPVPSTMPPESPAEFGRQLVGTLISRSAAAMLDEAQWTRLVADWRERLCRVGNDLDALDQASISPAERTRLEQEFSAILALIGLSTVDSAPGTPVDSGRHDVVQRVRSSTVSPNTILKTSKRGFQDAERVIKKAEVIVGVP